ncbi:hypothetical protein KKG72_06725 [bacterium]|nr:hypothetical protein [bacterium]MBU1993943.1 hypothetical protein [bacterium]
MKTIELRNALPLSIFSHEMLYALLEKSVSNVNDKISNLVKSGELLLYISKNKSSLKGY